MQLAAERSETSASDAHIGCLAHSLLHELLDGWLDVRNVVFGVQPLADDDAQLRLALCLTIAYGLLGALDRLGSVQAVKI